MKFFGIPVRFDPGSIIIMFLIGMNAPSSPPIIMPLAYVGLFMFSLLFHERAHIYAAQRYGIFCNEIVVHMFGGFAMLTANPKNPKEVFVIAAAGPLASILLAGAFHVLAAYILPVMPGSPYFLASYVAGKFAYINAALAVFNLIPLYPMDGGQMLFGGIWHFMKDRARALTTAIGIGRLIAAVIMGLLVLGFLRGAVSLFDILWIGMILYMIIGMQNRMRGGPHNDKK